MNPAVKDARTRAVRSAFGALLATLMLLATAPAALAATGAISGTVTDASSNAPIQNITVVVEDTTGGFLAFACTAANGTYTVGGLATGSYKVRFASEVGPCSATAGNYFTQYYNGKPSLQTADPVSVTDGSTTSGINAAMVAGGQISGTVKDASTMAGIGDVEVDIYDSSGNIVNSTCTAANGTYTVGGLVTGTYHVGFDPSGNNFGCNTTPNYRPQFYNNKLTLATADPVSVTTGSTTTGINASLTAGGQITGTVTDASTMAGISGIEVTVYDSSNNPVGFACTQPNGTYTVSGLATGTYHVGFDPNCGGGNYAPQFYNNKLTLATADPVSVTVGMTTSGINAAMAAGGQISGTVTDASTHAGIQDVEVDVYSSSNNNFPIRSTCTAANGTYTVGGLGTGTYHVGFDPSGSFNGCATTPSYAPLFYNNKSSVQSADPVSVTAGSTTSAINAALQSTTPHTLTVSEAGAGSGTVTGSAISCPGACSHSYPNGTTVTLTATPAVGSTFAGWAGGGCSGTGTCTVTMSSDQSVIATFTVKSSSGAQRPNANITKAKITKKKKQAAFSFTADNSPTGFECALQKQPKKKGKKGGKKLKLSFSSCSSPQTYKHLKHGKYLFEVRALNTAGTGPAASKSFTL